MKAIIFSVGLFLGYLAIQVLVVLVFTIPTNLVITSDQVRMISALITIIGGVIVLRLRGTAFIDQSVSLSWHRLLIAICILALILEIALDPVYNIALIRKLEEIPSWQDFYSQQNSSVGIYQLFSVLFLVPIGEELIFRRLIVEVLLKGGKKIWVAILVTSILFSLTHFSSATTVMSAFIFGLMAAIIYLRWGITSAIVFHILSNLFRLLLNTFPSKYWRVINFLDYGVGYWLIIILSLAGIVIFCIKSIVLIKASSSS